MDSKAVKQYLPLVKKIARSMVYRTPNLAPHLDDLVQVGLIAVWQNLDDYDPEARAFGNIDGFLGVRIKWAQQEYLRDNDYLSRSDRKALGIWGKTFTELTKQLGRTPRAAELAAASGIDMSEGARLYLGAEALSLNEPTGTDQHVHLDRWMHESERDNYTPEDALKDKQKVLHVIREIEDLNDRQKELLILYYDEEMPFIEIGRRFGITESRVCQIHTQITEKLKVRSRKY